MTALLGTVMVAAAAAAIPPFSEIGFAGETVQVAPASALALQLVLTDPT
jgi:hypothetical protein